MSSLSGSGDATFAPLSGLETVEYGDFTDINVSRYLYLKDATDTYEGYNAPLITTDKTNDDMIFNTTTLSSNFNFTVGTGEDTKETVFSINPTNGLSFEANNNPYTLSWNELSYLDGLRGNVQVALDNLSPDLSSNQGYWGNFWNNNTLTNPTINAVNVVPFPISDTDNYAVSITNSSRLTVGHAAIYMFIATIQIAKSAGSSDSDVYFWIRKNGTDVPDTAFKETIKNVPRLLCANWQVKLQANEYVELVWASPDSDMELLALPSGTSPTRPAIPSVIMTVSQVSFLVAGGAGLLPITYNAGTKNLICDASFQVIGTTDLSGNLKVKNLYFLTNDASNIYISNNTTMPSNNNMTIGYGANKSITTARNNIAIGTDALKNNTVGLENTVIGHFAQQGQTSFKDASYNTVIGYKANALGGAAGKNTIIGAYAAQNGLLNANREENVIIGYDAGGGFTQTQHIVRNNVVIGSRAGRTLGNWNAGEGNVLIGYMCCNNASYVGGAVCIGPGVAQNAGLGTVGGVIIGAGAGSSATNLNEACIIGSGAGVNNKGSYQTYLGTYAGQNCNGNGQINMNFFGFRTDLRAAGLSHSNSTVLGSRAYLNRSNALYVGHWKNETGEGLDGIFLQNKVGIMALSTISSNGTMTTPYFNVDNSEYGEHILLTSDVSNITLPTQHGFVSNGINSASASAKCHGLGMRYTFIKNYNPTGGNWNSITINAPTGSTIRTKNGSVSSYTFGPKERYVSFVCVDWQNTTQPTGWVSWVLINDNETITDYVDLTTAQTIAGEKTFSDKTTFGVVDINGNVELSGTVIDRGDGYGLYSTGSLGTTKFLYQDCSANTWRGTRTYGYYNVFNWADQENAFTRTYVDNAISAAANAGDRADAAQSTANNALNRANDAYSVGQDASGVAAAAAGVAGTALGIATAAAGGLVTLGGTVSTLATTTAAADTTLSNRCTALETKTMNMLDGNLVATTSNFLNRVRIWETNISVTSAVDLKTTAESEFDMGINTRNINTQSGQVQNIRGSTVNIGDASGAVNIDSASVNIGNVNGADVIIGNANATSVVINNETGNTEVSGANITIGDGALYSSVNLNGVIYFNGVPYVPFTPSNLTAGLRQVGLLG